MVPLKIAYYEQNSGNVETNGMYCAIYTFIETACNMQKSQNHVWNMKILHDQATERPPPLQAERNLLRVDRLQVQEGLYHSQRHQSSLMIFLWTDILGQCVPWFHAPELSHESILYQPVLLVQSLQGQVQDHHPEKRLQPLNPDV